MKLTCDEPLSGFVFNYNLRPYAMVFDSFDCWHGAGRWEEQD